MPDKASPAKGIIKSLGLVFGDIGTSPIYTLTVIFLLPDDRAHRGQRHRRPVAHRLDAHPAGHRAVRLAGHEPRQARRRRDHRAPGTPGPAPEIGQAGHRSSPCLSFIGISLIIGDGVITPAISILSAVEGMLLIPGFEGTAQSVAHRHRRRHRHSSSSRSRRRAPRRSPARSGRSWSSGSLPSRSPGIASIVQVPVRDQGGESLLCRSRS